LKTIINRSKIINDPVHGFITIPGGILYDLVSHPLFQRLRHIKQLGFGDYVYPGASHSRFQHSLGALHLMSQALQTLKERGVQISDEESEAALIAILLHDLGHGPFSHAMENKLPGNVSHELISVLLMEMLDKELEGQLSLAIKMFRGNYSREFFHDLISSQIDMDRLDYLVRDSFFSGVIEGSVGAERIIKMLNVCDDRLVVDEKGIYSIEKFLIARRLMYWQVYMHKTVIAAEKLLEKILIRVRYLISEGSMVNCAPAVKYFLELGISNESFLKTDFDILSFADNFLNLDDSEMISSMRSWSKEDDPILSELSKRLLSRNLFAIELSQTDFDKKRVLELTTMAGEKLGLSEQEREYYVYAGKVSNLTYAPAAPRVRILTKKGELKEITLVSDMLNHEALSREITKYYICYPKEIREK